MNPPDALGTLMLKHGCRCVYCKRRVQRVFKTDKSMATKDHIIPRGHGGTSEFKNLTLACYGCNHKRGDIEQGEFIRLMSANASPAEWQAAKKHAEQVTFAKRGEVAALRRERGEQVLTNKERKAQEREAKFARFRETFKLFNGTCVYCDDACCDRAPNDTPDKGINWTIGADGSGEFVDVLACLTCVKLIRSGTLTDSQKRHVRYRNQEMMAKHAVRRLASLPPVVQERTWPPPRMAEEHQQGA